MVGPRRQQDIKAADAAHLYSKQSTKRTHYTGKYTQIHYRKNRKINKLFNISYLLDCKENPIYIILFWELRGLSPNFHIQCLWAIYIFSGLVHIFPCSRIGRLVLEIYKYLPDKWVQELGDRTLKFCFGNNSFISGNTLMGTDIYIGFSPALYLQRMPMHRIFQTSTKSTCYIFIFTHGLISYRTVFQSEKEDILFYIIFIL